MIIIVKPNTRSGSLPMIIDCSAGLSLLSWLSVAYFSIQAETNGVEVEYVSAPHEYEELLAPKDEMDEEERMGLGSSGLDFGNSTAGS